MKKDFNFLRKIYAVLAVFVLVVALFSFVACDTKPKKKTGKELFDIIGPSVCTVRSDYSEGTGFVIDTDNNAIYILTNKHVFEKNKIIAQTARVEFLSGKKHEAKLLGYNSYHDIAILKVDTIEAKNYSSLEFEKGDLFAGEKLYSIGNALQLGLGMFDGIISNPEQVLELEDKRVPVLQVTVPINAGCSGGPVFNEYGFVVGVGTYQMPQKDDRLVDGISFCVSIRIAERIARQIMNENGEGKKDATECFLLSVEYPKAEGFNKFELNVVSLNFSAVLFDGALVVTHATSLATDAGMQLSVGDKITKLGNLELAKASVTDIFTELYSFTDTRIDTNVKADRQLKITYENNDIKKELTVLNKNEKNY